MKDKLINLADHFDSIGMHKEASYIDNIIKNAVRNDSGSVLEGIKDIQRDISLAQQNMTWLSSPDPNVSEVKDLLEGIYDKAKSLEGAIYQIQSQLSSL